MRRTPMRPPGSPVTVNRAIHLWHLWMTKRASSEMTTERWHSCAHVWAREMRIGSRRMVDITEVEIDDWLNAKNTIKLSTRMLRFTAIKSLFRYCHIHNWCAVNYAKLAFIRIRQMPHELKEPRAKSVFTDEEVKLILDHCLMRVKKALGYTFPHQAEAQRYRFWYFATLLARQTGLRLGDIAALEAASLRMKGKIVIWTRKTATRVELDINPEVVEHWRHAIENRIFPEQYAMIIDPKRRSILSDQFGRILEVLKIKEGHSFLCLRATKATEMDANGSPVEDIAKQLGNSPDVAVKHYVLRPRASELSTDALLKELARRNFATEPTTTPPATK